MIGLESLVTNTCATYLTSSFGVMEDLISLRFGEKSFVIHYLVTSIIAFAIFCAGSLPNLLTILKATFFGFPVIEYPQFTFLVLSNPASFLASPTVEVIPLISLFNANLTFSVVVPFNLHFSGLSIK